MKKILSWTPLYPLFLTLICLFIALQNYTPGTYLTGWDTLHPEFNFPLNFQRLFFGVWRADQGLGAVSGHSAMADIPRVFILWLLHFVLPTSLLRYSYVFLCLIVGPLGFFFLVRSIFKRFHYVNILSFVGALAYLLNLGTVQQFYVPFEMFPTQWAFLPWIILYSIKFLQQHSRRNLIIFGIITLLSTPQAYAAHLWYPFFGLYCLFLFIYTIIKKIKINIPLILIITTICINSFWLIPNVYYAATSTQNPKNDKSNRLYSQEYLLRNRQTGTLGDTFLIRGFYMNWEAFNFQTKTNQPLMPEWQKHFKNTSITLIGSLIFIFAFTGLVASFLNKDAIFISLSPLFIISFGLLANNTPFFSQIFDLLIKIPLVEEIFRFIFTKLSIILTFSIALYFTYFLHFLFVTLHRHFVRLICLVITACLVIYAFPVFQGQLISNIVKTKIPESYFQTWSYLNSQPAGKVLTLPLHTFSGWQFYDWKYQGSGLIWFGSPQGFLDRDSDRWELKNEEAYREFYFPLYSKNQQLFISSLDKYHIGYILWDKSNISTSSKNQDQITFKNEIADLLQSLSDQQKVQLIRQFGSIQIYKVRPQSSLIQVETINSSIGPRYTLGFYDAQFNGQDYVTQKNSLEYPFRSILSATDRLDPKQFNIYHQDSEWKLKINGLDPIGVGITQIIISKTSAADNPDLVINHNNVSLKSINSTKGLNLDLKEFPHSQGFIFGIESKYIQGIPLRFCLRNSYSDLCVLEDQLSKNQNLDWDYFLIPPMDDFDSYQFEINAISYGNFPTNSEISQIRVIPVPFDYLSQLSNSSPGQPTDNNQTFSTTFKVIFPNNTLISIKNTPPVPNKYIVLYQSYSPGWVAFYFDGLRPVFLEHTLINNWANGWLVSSNPSTIYILFWPQLLQFLGFGLLIGAFIFIVRHRS